MNRAIVMSLEGNRAVVLAPGGQFIRVPNRNHLQVGDEIELEEGVDLPGALKRRNFRTRTWAAGSAACAAAIVLLAGSFWLRTPSVVAYVSMDVNPSIELGIDGKERVRELHALNRDAEPIVAELQFKGKDVAEVAKEIADELAERHLLNGGDSEVVLASVAVKKVDEQWESEVTEKMRQAIEKAGTTEPSEPADPADSTDSSGIGTNAGGGSDSSPHDTQTKSSPEVTTIKLPKEVREEAKENGVSAGKMAFWLKAESQGHELSLDELKHNSLKKIAASWGGVQQVLDGSSTSSSSTSSNGSADWKQLLKDAQAKVQELEKQKAPSPSAKATGAATGPAASFKSDSSAKNGDGVANGKTKENGQGQDKQDKDNTKEQSKGQVKGQAGKQGKGQSFGGKNSGSNGNKGQGEADGEFSRAIGGFGFGASTSGGAYGFGGSNGFGLGKVRDSRNDEPSNPRGEQASKDRK